MRPEARLPPALRAGFNILPVCSVEGHFAPTTPMSECSAPFVTAQRKRYLAGGTPESLLKGADKPGPSPALTVSTQVCP